MALLYGAAFQILLAVFNYALWASGGHVFSLWACGFCTGIATAEVIDFFINVKEGRG